MTAFAGDGCSTRTGLSEVVTAAAPGVARICGLTARPSTAAGAGAMRDGNVGDRWTGDAEGAAMAEGFGTLVEPRTDGLGDTRFVRLAGMAGIGAGGGCRMVFSPAITSPGPRSREPCRREPIPLAFIDDRCGCRAASVVVGAAGCEAAETDDDDREMNTTKAMNAPIISTKSRNPMSAPSEGSMLTADD